MHIVQLRTENENSQCSLEDINLSPKNLIQEIHQRLCFRFCRQKCSFSPPPSERVSLIVFRCNCQAARVCFTCRFTARCGGCSAPLCSARRVSQPEVAISSFA